MEDQVLEKIRTYAFATMSQKGDFRHNWQHVERVVINAKKSLIILNVKNNVDANLLFAACYLHDVPTALVPFNISNYFRESQIATKFIPQILKHFALSEYEKDVLFKAIIAHPLSIPWRKLNRNSDYYTKILQDADSLDYFSTSRMNLWINQFSNTKWKVLLPLFRLYMNTGRKFIRFFLNNPQLEKLAI